MKKLYKYLVILGISSFYLIGHSKLKIAKLVNDTKEKVIYVQTIKKIAQNKSLDGISDSDLVVMLQANETRIAIKAWINDYVQKSSTRQQAFRNVRSVFQRGEYEDILEAIYTRYNNMSDKNKDKLCSALISILSMKRIDGIFSAMQKDLKGSLSSTLNDWQQCVQLLCDSNKYQNIKDMLTAPCRNLVNKIESKLKNAVQLQ